jgi:hypothetical protein
MPNLILTPGSLAVLLFVVEAASKWVLLDSQAFFFDIGPRLSLWAVAIFSTLSVANQGVHQDRSVIVVPPKLLSCLLLSVCTWFISFVTSCKALMLFQNYGWTTTIYVYLLLGLFISGFAIGSALRQLGKKGDESIDGS